MNYRNLEIKIYEKAVTIKLKLLKPLLFFLSTHNISPNFISGLSLVSGLLAVPIMYISPKLMFLPILGHALLDGLDGALARHLKLDSNIGKLIDLAVGNLVISIFFIFLGLTNFISLKACIIFVATNLVTEIISVQYFSSKTKIQSGGACHFAKIFLTIAILITISLQTNWNLEILTGITSIYLSLLGIVLVILKFKRQRINTVS